MSNAFILLPFTADTCQHSCNFSTYPPDLLAQTQQCLGATAAPPRFRLKTPVIQTVFRVEVNAARLFTGTERKRAIGVFPFLPDFCAKLRQLGSDSFFSALWLQIWTVRVRSSRHPCEITTVSWGTAGRVKVDRLCLESSAPGCRNLIRRYIKNKDGLLLRSGEAGGAAKFTYTVQIRTSYRLPT